MRRLQRQTSIPVELRRVQVGEIHDRSGDGGEVRVLQDRIQSNNVLDRIARSVDSDGGGEREHQFDGQHPEECKSKSSFFNWWGFGICVGAFSSHLILNYIQDNLSWALGFGIPCIAMVLALLVYFLGTNTYRFSIKSTFVRIGQVFIAAIRNRRTTTTTPSTMVVDEELESVRLFNKPCLHGQMAQTNTKMCVGVA
ncbi:hypothetical protein QYF36_010789 [Acer negundo]|nr:hypothetical protein QYF36_010789 [Acer negundo]